jgi:hypothetical protein
MSAARLPYRAIARQARARAARTWTDGDDELQVLSLWSLFEQRLHVGQKAALPAHVAGEVEIMLLAARGSRRRQRRQAELLAPAALGVAQRRKVAHLQLCHAVDMAHMRARVRLELEQRAARVRLERDPVVPARLAQPADLVHVVAVDFNGSGRRHRVRQ